MPFRKHSFAERMEIFLSKINKQGPYPHKKACKQYPEIAGTRCWIWTGCLDNDGYGIFWLSRKNVKAHRVAWILQFGEIPKKTPCVLHKCDNEACMRHLFVGSLKDNSDDKVAKRRHARGDKLRIAQASNRSKGIKHSIAMRKYHKRKLNISRCSDGL